ncbi:MAG: HAD family hydrolase [Aminipila sp.]
MIKAAIFDFDGTLSSERKYIYGCFNGIETDIKDKFGINDAGNKLISLFNESWDDTFERLLKSENVTYTKEDIKELVKLYRNVAPIVELYNDSIDLLEKLKKQDIKLALLTNGYYNIQNEKIKLSGIEKLFDVIEIPDLCGRDFWKPDIRRAKIILDTLGVEAKESIYIGDSDGDYLLANSLGMKMAFIEREDSVNNFSFRNECTYVVKSLTDIIKLIGR